MTFGEALVALNKGELLTRSNWNGKNMFIFKTVGNVVDKSFIPSFKSLPDKVKKFLLPLDHDVVFNSSITMYTAGGEMQPGWLCSQADLLAADWEILLDM